MSNIAWHPHDRFAAYELLACAGVTGLEIAPKLFLPEMEDRAKPSDKMVERAKAELLSFGLELVSMQSLLYGETDVSLFEDASSRARLHEAMVRKINLAGRLGIGNLVFGSPKQRARPEAMGPKEAQDIAQTFFFDLAEHAVSEGTVVTIEPNPIAYGTNFLNSFNEAADFVRIVEHPSLLLTLDLGAMYMNNDFENIEEAVVHNARYIHHVHISEPMLAPAPARIGDATQVLKALDKIVYKGPISIEMKPPEASLTTIAECLRRLNEAIIESL
ncbi:MAG: sugar phosphate isomerase/epimerase [Hyphomonadaceae bacterium]|nr:sugar phosphate isomerase/epimerase [Hyphomonadaceae bacterium]